MNKISGYLWLPLLFVLSVELQGQGQFQVRFDTLPIPNMPRLHSFAYAVYEGKWLLIGGRQDGVHPKYGGFDTPGANQRIWVVDPQTTQTWDRPIAELPDTLQEQLRSANMEFLQAGNELLFVGGYGYSDKAKDHRTYPYLTLIDVPGVVRSIMEGGPLLPHFQQIRDTFFSVTGGQLQHLGDTLYLVGGHLFDGIYSANSDNPTQRYTEAIRKFTLGSGANGKRVTSKSESTDQLNLHRRDYNLSPHVFQNREVGLMAFSGVFQPGLALAPFLNIVGIRASGHSPVSGFSQFLANYHCARIPLYAAAKNEMHTLFFGGMSGYWLDARDSLMRDARLPFVKTASRVTRLANGNYEEVPFAAELPYYTGTGAEFIKAETLPLYAHEIIDFDKLSTGSHLVGYIVGGIVTPGSQRNPFSSNAAVITSANNQVLRVFIEKDLTSSTPARPLDGRYSLITKIYPNPATELWNLNLQLPRAGHLRATLQDAAGRIVQTWDWGQQTSGGQMFELPASRYAPGIYQLSVNLDGVFSETSTIVKQ